jgi:phosphoglycolate phosphatase-like HAD superfamily hydrolase
MERTLALDFDGVISDSAPEAFLVALRTYTRMRPGSRLEAARARVDRPDGDLLGRIRSEPVYARFVELMPLGNRAEDYGVVLSILDAGRFPPDQESYDAERDARDPAFLRDFHARFYAERDAFSDSDPKGWRALLAPYPDFVSLLRRRAGDARLAIATAKDRRSVGLLLRDYGIEDLFAPELVLDKETGVSKRAHLEALRDRLDAAFSDITFVDDKVTHLDRVAPLGVRCVLAAWGYNAEREHEQARERGHLVCTLEDAERLLFG